MVDSFNDVPIRINGAKILAAFFNTLREAGIALEGGTDQKMTFTDGAGFIPLTDSNGAAQIIDKAALRTVSFHYTTALRNDTEGRREYGRYIAYFEAETPEWNLDQKPEGGKYTDAARVSSGVLFRIDPTTGALEVFVPTLGGTGYDGVLRWSILKKWKAESL